MRRLGDLGALLPLLLSACLAEPTHSGGAPPIQPDQLEVSVTELQVLPFGTRMSKLAHVLGRPIDDPLFDTLYQQRFALGDHDYARSLRPDRRWSARKIGIWIQGLLPVCTSERFTDLYPRVADDPGALITSAYGRPADAADLLSIEEVAAGGELDPNTSVCLAILSSLEFVAS